MPDDDEDTIEEEIVDLETLENTPIVELSDDDIDFLIDNPEEFPTEPEVEELMEDSPDEADEEDMGDEGQDRKTYMDDQDRESYTVDPELTDEESLIEEFVEAAGGDETPAIPEVPDSPQPVNNLGVDPTEVEAIRSALKEGYLENILDDDALSGVLPNEVRIPKEKGFPDVSPIQLPEEVVDPMVDMLEGLEAVMGEKTTNLIVRIAEMQGLSMSDVVSVIPMTDFARIDILNDREGNPRFIQLKDASGKDVTAQLGLELNSDGEVQVQQVIADSIFTDLDHDTSHRYSSDGMGASIESALQEFSNLIGEKERRADRVALLKWMRTLIFKLNGVFGFDDYQQLEALIAAWLMRNSTCRLSGIPGTGKTTVINCAATLLGNSYGYHTSKTYYAGKQYRLNTEITSPTQIFDNNTSSDNVYTPTVFEKGQYYDIKYNQKAYSQVYLDWDEWRFTDWPSPDQLPRTHTGNYDYTTITPSGAYMYDFPFLRNREEAITDHRGNMLLPPVDAKKTVTTATFRKLLTNCWECKIPEDFSLETYTAHRETAFADNPHWQPEIDRDGETIPNPLFVEATKETVVKPIQVCDDQGNFQTFENAQPMYGPYRMRLRDPKFNSKQYILSLKSIPEEARKNLIFHAEMDGLYTDTGRNEGYWLRKMMCHFLRDSRASNQSQLFDIANEMLNEIGVAKIDYDKRPDEVLYGLEIQSQEVVDPVSLDKTNTFVFEPEPKPVVTQPVKFFNEANRSQSGVEDAILGLIAERMVEYRGKVFKSPDFVAWMDTNPHQKGNDLAFTDRIDMELLFKSISLGGRYDVLSDKFGTGKDANEPQVQLCEDLTKDSNDNRSFTPMRMTDLMKVWETVSKRMRFSIPGSSYDGLRDISMISMMFSQIFAKRPTQLAVGATTIEYSFADPNGMKVHESPLLDYSITTNTVNEGEKTTSPLIHGDALEGNLRVFGEFGSEDSDVSHAPSAFTRVLGFRFSNSIVKLSQAFAFLRGKEYVGRQEILDAIPYTLAHRLGRAKAGAMDLEGNNKGLDGGLITYVNEQEFLREVIVKGYLQQQTNTGIETEGTLLDNWDLFYQRCRDVLASVPAVWQYESEVMLPLHNTISENEETLPSITPVHWHICAMVVEEERKATSAKKIRNYSSSFAGPAGGDANTSPPKDYHEMYSQYQNMILDPTSGAGEPILFDYYRLRGFIAREPNLFTHDRERLLTLLEDEMRSISGADIRSSGDEGVDSVYAFPQAVTPPISGQQESAQNDLYAEGGPFPRPQRIGWRTYFDSMGPYGVLIGRGQTGGLNTLALGLNGSITEPLDATDVADSARNNADQGLRVIGRHQIGASGSPSGPKGSITKVLRNIQSGFDQYVGDGLVFTNFGDDTQTMKKISLNEWTIRASKVLDDNIKDPNTAPEDDIIGCFVLKHAPTSTPQAARHGINGDDTLRFWVRLQRVGDPAESQNDIEYVTMMLTVGITSALGTTQTTLRGEEAEGPDINILPLDYAPQYNTQSFQDHNAWGSAANEYMKKITKSLKGSAKIKTNACLIDVGNMSLQDRNFYNTRFRDAIL